MAYKLLISIKAQNDAKNAVDYYDKINPALGTRFLTELFDAYARLMNNPQFYSLVSSHSGDTFRDIKLRSFPYVVIFEIKDPAVVIITVINTYQKPLIG